MHKLSDITEDEVIAVFLQAEINSNRFGHHITERLKRDHKDRTIIDNPDLITEDDNKYRRKILGEYRGYGQNRLLFEDFPTKVVWERVVLTREDLSKIKYIDYDYWVELSQGTRFAKDSIETIEKNKKIFDVSNEGFKKAAEAVKSGTTFPEMIVVATNPGNEMVVVEGHLRLTAYLLAKDQAPSELEAIIGYSSDFVNWGLY